MWLKRSRALSARARSGAIRLLQTWYLLAPHAVPMLVCRFQPIVEASPSLVPDGFIYLQAEPDVCMTRLQHRQRAEESGVSSVMVALPVTCAWPHCSPHSRQWSQG